MASNFEVHLLAKDKIRIQLMSQPERIPKGSGPMKVSDVFSTFFPLKLAH
ncbi:hypothetical protein COLO4_20822 [Corchorus olitorius]|uniref:Uncharacterized protein n=1 Tax=Corchorus olitorius TaxID=93759 RepID=A0A1R3IWT0_9ROSI|nr:hypothetical protein COLO4_20822 [Corchorus olitorius]